MIISILDNVKQFRWRVFLLVTVSQIYIYFKMLNKKCCTSYVSVKKESGYYTVKIQALQVRVSLEIFFFYMAT